MDEIEKKCEPMNFSEVGEMRKRRIKLANGRYMIFYTFGDDQAFEKIDDKGKASEVESV